MAFVTRLRPALVACAVIAPFFLSACSETTHGLSAAALKDAITPGFVKSGRYSERDKECMARAMFFESHRSSRDGMIAVGTVVMNRKRSGQYPDTVCGVVGQKRQFAPGVLTRKMNSKALPDVMEAAEAVLKGERSPKLKNAMHFHTAGLKFKYKNMHYIQVAGGNAFYEKRGRKWQPLPPENAAEPAQVMVASATTSEPAAASQPIVASQPAAASTAVAAAPAAKPADSQPTAMALAAPAPAKAAVIAGAFPPPPGEPVAAADVDTAAEQQPVLSLQASQEEADAIGALLLTQERPFQSQ